MSPRPKRVSDHELIQAATRVVVRLGAEHARLSDVAVESGLAPATLVQRFGSREGLLNAVSMAITAEVTDAFRSIHEPRTSLVAEALASIDSSSHVAFFAARRYGAPAYATELRKQVAFMLGRGLETGWVAPCDVATLARQIQVGFLGLALVAMLEQTPLESDAIALMIDEVLAPYL